MSLFENITNNFVKQEKGSSKNYRNRIGKFQGWISVAINSILFLIKLIIGMLTGSVSVLADAIHTFSDVLSSGVVIWGFHESEKPADKEHPYGHGRAEYIATLIIAVLLCVVGIEFIETAIYRIMNPDSINPAWWMIGVIGGTIFIKEFIARYAEFLSAKIASGTLHADAWHHRIDALSSMMVILAMIAGKYGYHHVDGWAGLGVALFIIWTGIQISKSAIDDLIGKPPTHEEVEEIRLIVQKIVGVLGVHDISVHRYGRDSFISIHIEINAVESQGRAHDIAEEVEMVLSKSFQVEPTVHIDPVQPDNPLVQKVESFLENTWGKDDRVENWHDLRVIETEKHNVILFGINTSIHLSHHAVLNFCREIENSLIKEFPGYEIEIKRSPLYSY